MPKKYVRNTRGVVSNKKYMIGGRQVSKKEFHDFATLQKSLQKQTYEEIDTVDLANQAKHAKKYIKLISLAIFIMIIIVIFVSVMYYS